MPPSFLPKLQLTTYSCRSRRTLATKAKRDRQWILLKILKLDAVNRLADRILQAGLKCVLVAEDLHVEMRGSFAKSNTQDRCYTPKRSDEKAASGARNTKSRHRLSHVNRAKNTITQVSRMASPNTATNEVRRLDGCDAVGCAR